MGTSARRRRGSRAALLALLAGLAAGPPRALADEGGAGREAVAPLRSLLAQVREACPGQVLEVELGREGHGEGPVRVYEVKLLTREGRVVELEYDAITLELLERKGGHPE